MRNKMKRMGIILSLLILITSCDQKKKDSIAIRTTEINSLTQNPLAESIKRGKQVYMDMCVTCHLPDGKGVENIYPPLANSDYLIKKQDESIRAIKYGLQGEIVVNGVTYNQIMASMGLYDDEVADVMNYINNSWGNKNDKIITEAQVANIKE